MREAERYREVATKCSFTGQGSGFAYHPSFTVGETLYQVGRDGIFKVCVCSSASFKATRGKSLNTTDRVHQQLQYERRKLFIFLTL